MNQLFCDCKAKCTCKKCPDVLKNLNITVTGSTCRFNRKPKPGKSDIKYIRQKSAHSITSGGRPSSGKLSKVSTDTCFNNDKAAPESKNQKDNKEYRQQKSAHSITSGGRPSVAKLNPDTCFNIDKATLESKKQKDNKEYMRKCIEFASEDGMKTEDGMDIECISCDVAAKAIKTHKNLDIGMHQHEEELNQLTKRNSRGEKKRKVSSNTAIKGVSKTVIKGVSKTAIKNPSKTTIRCDGKPVKKN